MSLLKVVGVDPALRNFGLVKATINIADPNFPIEIQHLELVSTETDAASKKVVRKNSDDLQRARKLHHSLHQFIGDANMVFAEIPVGSQSARAMASYGVCIGVLASIRKPLVQLTPTEVKLAAVGDKNASKRDMINWATTAYPEANWLRVKRNGKMELVDKNEHLADAVATLHAGLLTDQFIQAVSILAVA